MNRKKIIEDWFTAGNGRKTLMRIFQLLFLALNCMLTSESAAITRSSVSSGNWDNPLCWSPVGTPTASDDVYIGGNNTITINNNGQVHNLTVSSSAFFTSLAEKTLTITGNITVNGTADMNGGNIILQNYGSAFTLGPDAAFTWSPGNNTLAGSTLFTNGIESFDPTSTLIIRKWYDYSVALGEVVTGNFGNLNITTLNGMSSIVEWNQKNTLQNHKVPGTLTIERGWLTLDKGGLISSTEIGQIVLTSINSTFIAHNGTHPNSFALTTNSVINNGGMFYGLNDGNGNPEIHVLGNFYNSGNVKIINNSGVSGVANGNATFRVDGDYIQTSGDTRIIYNITTSNSGTYNSTFNNLTITGGIFMGQSACHTGGNTNYLTIANDLTVQLNSASDKFRGNGITSIGQTVNNAKLYLTIGNNLSISGNANAEFTSSASSGMEKIQVSGNLNISGCKVNFNYGTSQASHTVEFYVGGNLVSNGGTTSLSFNQGNLNSLIGKGIKIQNGTVSIKGNSGAATLNVNGAFQQSGGYFFLHSNNTTVTNDIVRMNVNGNFRQSAGSIIYDNNNLGSQHTISLRGDSCILEGTGIVYREGAGSSAVSGLLSFDKTGKTIYERIGNTHFLEQVIQSINRKCEVSVTSGTMRLSSLTSNGAYSLRILPDAKLSLINSNISSNEVYGSCNIQIDSSAVLSFTNQEGFYGSLNSAIKNNVIYSLHPYSVVEYSGIKKQNVTGIYTRFNRPELNYGIVRINMSGPKYAAKVLEDISIRTRLELVQGKVQLNNHTITISNGNPDGILRKKGYIESGQEGDSPAGKICWNSISTGVHEFPFGKSYETYIPVKLNVTESHGNSVCINTYETNTDEFSTNNLTGNPNANNLAYAVKRRWDIDAHGVKGEITLSFDDSENPNQTDYNFYNAVGWQGNSWTHIAGTSNGRQGKNCRAASISDIGSWTNFALIPDTISQSLKIRLIDAKEFSNEVQLIWESVADKSASFTIEKSNDGINYFEIGQVQNNIQNGTTQFKYTDPSPVLNTSYYRIKLTMHEEEPVYSETKSVSKIRKESGDNSAIQSIHPNPFSDYIEVNYSTTDVPVFQIVDAQGKIVYSKKGEDGGSNRSQTIDNLGLLNKGVYFLSLISNGKMNTVKIIKN